MKAEDRAICTERLNLICRRYKLIQFVEKQETHARKAAALQRARRWYKRHKQAARLFEKADELEKSGLNNDAKPLYEKARSLRQSVPSLPQALEQKAWRLQTLGRSRDESFAKPAEFYSRVSKRGKKHSDALRITIDALQACAASWKLNWTKGAAPPRLIEFIVTVLTAAGIKYPGHKIWQNRSKFLRLLNKPTKQTLKKQPLSVHVEVATETKLERRLSKMFL
jgi:hypothetical protein